MPEQAFLVSRGDGRSLCSLLYFCPPLKQVPEGWPSVARALEATASRTGLTTSQAEIPSFHLDLEGMWDLRSVCQRH